MFKVNNKDTRTTPMAFFWCLYCQLWTYFTPCSSASIVNFEQENAGFHVPFFDYLKRLNRIQTLQIQVSGGDCAFKLSVFAAKKKPGRTFIKFENNTSLTPRAINNLKIIKKLFVILFSSSKYLMKGISMSIKLLLLSNKNEIALKISCIGVCLKRRQYTLAVISGKQIWIKQITTFILRPGRHMNIQSTFDFGRASTE